MDAKPSGQRFLAVVVVLVACASSSEPGEVRAAPGPGDSNVITRAEIDRGQWGSVYELVRDLRPRWLWARGVDSLVDPGEVQVYIDGTRLGGVELLWNLPTGAIDRLEWVDPIDAAGRWGLNHAHGVIAIFYSPAQEPPTP